MAWCCLTFILWNAKYTTGASSKIGVRWRRYSLLSFGYFAVDQNPSGTGCAQYVQVFVLLGNVFPHFGHGLFISFGSEELLIPSALSSIDIIPCQSIRDTFRVKVKRHFSARYIISYKKGAQMTEQKKTVEATVESIRRADILWN